MLEQGPYQDVDVKGKESISRPANTIKKASTREAEGHVLDTFGLDDQFLPQ